MLENMLDTALIWRYKLDYQLEFIGNENLFGEIIFGKWINLLIFQNWFWWYEFKDKQAQFCENG